MNPIFPSILSTNYFNLESRLSLFASQHIEFIHLDVMDGHFVNNISFGPATIPAIKSQFPFQIDSHLMVDNPEKLIPLYAEAGSNWISIHLETNSAIENNLRAIRDAGCKAGLVINPDTPVEKLFPFLAAADYILIMSVFPGYGGQTFISETLPRIQTLKQEIDRQSLPCLIQVDGGIKDSNLKSLKEAGADLFVIGTFLFNADDIPGTVTKLLDSLNGERHA